LFDHEGRCNEDEDHLLLVIAAAVALTGTLSIPSNASDYWELGNHEIDGDSSSSPNTGVMASQGEMNANAFAFAEIPSDATFRLAVGTWEVTRTYTKHGSPANRSVLLNLRHQRFLLRVVRISTVWHPGLGWAG
jgi:hypothetical protein